jgi:hypothetical protein
MAPYRAKTGGVFGSGLYPDSKPSIDVGGGIDALFRGATSLIQQAYLRRQAEEQRKLQTEERTRQHTREDAQDAMAREKFGMERETHEADLASKGFTPARTETKSSVEPGKVESGGLTGKGRVTPPRVTQTTSKIAAAYDPSNTPKEKKAASDRARKSGHFATLYQRQFPRSTPEEAAAAGDYAADNPSIADNLLFPKPDAWTQFKQEWDYRGANPHRGARDGSASSPIGVALRTTSQQVDDTRSDISQVRSTIAREFQDGAPDEYSSPAERTRYRQLMSQDSSLTARADSVGKIRDAYAGQQQREGGLTGGSASPKQKPARTSNPNAEEESRLARLANDAIARGADPAAVSKRLREQLAKLRKKK